MTDPLTICVYCGSRPGHSQSFRDVAMALGTTIGRLGWQMVYGGGRAGLMGLVADAALASGARVKGVIPESLMQRELGHRGLHELQVVETMHQRKRSMADSADAFVALPGGIGTFEELFEVWSWRHLAYHDRPIGLLDVEGFYAPLLAMLERAVDAGFMTRDQMAMLDVDSDPERLLRTLGAKAMRATAPDDLRRI